MFFEGRRVRHRRVQRSHAHERPIKIMEGLFEKYRRNLARDSAGLRVFVHDQAFVGLFHGIQNRLFIQRKQRAQINHFGFDAFFCQGFGRFERSMHHCRVGNNGDVLTFAAHGGFADRHGVIAGGNFSLDAAVEKFVLEEEHRVIVAHRGLQQALGIVGRRRIDHLQPGRVHEIHFRICRMERSAVHAASGRPANHHGRRGVPEVVSLGDEIRNLIEGADDEIDELHFANGAQAAVAHPASSADNGALADRRVNHALRAEALQQTFAGLEGAAVHADVFPHQNDRRIAFHLLEAIKQAMFEEMERDPAVILMGEDVGVYGGAFKTSEGLLERFGSERVIDTPISESAIIGAACGMSYCGLRPICEMQFIDFIVCAFNQITNFVAKGHYLWNAPAPMVIRGPSGGGVHGGPFHSANPEMYFVHTPGLKVIYPSTPYDAKGLLKAAVRDNNPVLFFEHKFLYRRIKGEVPAGDYTVPIGKAAVRREGKHVTIISYAAMMHASLEAAEALAKEGIEAEVIDLRTLLPLDEETILNSVKKTNKCLVVHEDTKTGGIAGEIAAILFEKAFHDLDGPLMRVTSLDTPVPYAPTLEEHFLPNAKKVFSAAKELARY